MKKIHYRGIEMVRNIINQKVQVVSHSTGD